MDLDNPQSHDFPKSKRCLVIYSRPRAWSHVASETKPSLCPHSRNFPSPHPRPYCKSSYSPSHAAEPNPCQTNKCSGCTLTANSHQLRRSLPPNGNPTGSRHSPSLASNQTQLGEERHGVGEGMPLSVFGSPMDTSPVFSPAVVFPSIKLTAREQAPSVLCSIHNHL